MIGSHTGIGEKQFIHMIALFRVQLLQNFFPGDSSLQKAAGQIAEDSPVDIFGKITTIPEVNAHTPVGKRS